jgi:4-amino-4-deoxy-L-arabinose transferase-like glycosyltransferase
MGRDLRAFLAWTTVLLLAAGALAAAAFASRDPDSTVYAGISARLAVLPIGSWLVPEWWGLWGFEGPFREHPIGIFVLPALLARAGYPAEQAAYAVGAVCSVLAALMIQRVARPVLREHERSAVVWAAMLLPIAFTYRIRANQEYPVLILLLAAVHATDRARTAPVWIAGTVVATVGLFLVKGIFVVFVPIVCGLWLILVRRGEHGANRMAWLGIGASVVAVALSALGYETLYRQAAGDSFFTYYIQQRLGSNTGLAGESGGSGAARFSNFPWYIARVIWFAIPGSLVLMIFAARRDSWRTRIPPAVTFCVAVAAVYIVAMSLGSNRADRFVFPAYFAVGIGGAVVAMRRWAGVDRWARWIDRQEPYGTPLLWFGLFLLTFLTAARLPRVQF